MSNSTTKRQSYAHHGPVYQAYQMLHVLFILVPIITGIDKLLNVSGNWDHYLSPFLLNLVQDNSRTFFVIVGVVEVLVGIGVWFKPKLFSYILAAWFLCTIANLITLGVFYDIVIRDAVLLIASLALARLSTIFDRS